MLKKQDQKGLTLLYKQYGASIFGGIIRIIKDKEIAEEVLQQTFLNVWNKIDLYQADKGSFYTWISRIARNAAIDKTRLKSYQNKNNTSIIDDTLLNMPNTEINSNAVDVERLTNMLDEKYKIVLDKIYLQGYSQSDVSKELGIPLGTVKTRVRTAITILRKELKNEKNLFLGMLLISFLILLFVCL